MHDLQVSQNKTNKKLTRAWPHCGQGWRLKLATCLKGLDRHSTPRPPGRQFKSHGDCAVGS